MYFSAQCHYLSFCQLYHIPPFPLSEVSVCLFAAFLAHQGLKVQSIFSYLSALRHLQVSSGLPPPQQVEWPRLQYMLKGIARGQASSLQKWLPITATIMKGLQVLCASMSARVVEARLLWAACCLRYFGFMRAGEFTLDRGTASPSICQEDEAVDSHQHPSLVRIRLRRAKTNPFGRGISIL